MPRSPVLLDSVGLERHQANLMTDGQTLECPGGGRATVAKNASSRSVCNPAAG
jgi:hypothetical protein